MVPPSEALPFNGALFGAIQLISFLAIYPTSPKNAVILPVKLLASIFLGWASYYLITKTTTGDNVADFGIGSAVLTQSMVAFDAMFFVDPAMLRRKNEQGTITEQTLKVKLWWMVDFFTNLRGIDWQHEPTHLPPRPPPSMGRLGFIASRLFISASCVAFERLVVIFNTSHPGTTTPGKALMEAQWIHRTMGVMGFVAGGYVRLTMLHSMLAIVAVGLGLSKPQRWPRPLGSLVEGYTIRRIWRLVWHQMFRRCILSIGTFVATRILRLPPLNQKKSLINSIHKIVLLFTAFILMGVTHLGGEIMLLKRIDWGALIFFGLQPFAILIEKAMFKFWTGLGFSLYPNKSAEQVERGEYPSSSTNKHKNAGASQQTAKKGTETRPYLWIRLIGYVWVVSYLAFSLAYLVEPLVSVQSFTHPKADLRQNSLKDVLLFVFRDTGLVLLQ